MYFGLPSIVFYLLNLAVVFAALRFLVYKPVVRFLKKRESDVAQHLDDAREEREKAEKAREAYEARLEQTQKESAAILAEASKSAAERADDIIARAAAEAAELKKRAERDIESEKQHARRELKDELADQALAIAQRIIKRELSAEDNRHLIEDFFENVG